MRWVFLSLVLINAMILAWRFLSPPAKEAPPAPALAKAVEAAESDLAAQTITLLEEVGRQEVELKPVSPESISITEGEPSEQPASRSLEVAAEASLVIPPDVLDACYWAGPFVEEDQGRALVTRLRGLNISAEERTQRASGGWRYWVYIPPKATREEAKSELAVLKNLGLDSYLIYRGEKANGISLGLFSRKQLADAQYAAVKKHGFNVVMDSYERQVSQRWVAVNKVEMDAVGEGLLPRMLKNKTDVKIIEKKCELPVASHTDIH